MKSFLGVSTYCSTAAGETLLESLSKRLELKVLLVEGVLLPLEIYPPEITKEV